MRNGLPETNGMKEIYGLRLGTDVLLSGTLVERGDGGSVVVILQGKHLGIQVRIPGEVVAKPVGTSPYTP